MKTAKVPHRRAFTLIELLVVIAILALLLSVLMPSIAEAKRLAVGVKCLSNLRQIGLMTHNYFAENNDWIPFAYHMTETNYSHYSTPSAPGGASQLRYTAASSPSPSTSSRTRWNRDSVRTSSSSAPRQSTWSPFQAIAL